jgi:hypothetical protein
MNFAPLKAKKDLMDMPRLWTTIICGSGVHGAHLGRNEEVLSWFRHYQLQPMALKITKDGHPSHPLYVSYDVVPTPLKSGN